jgi:hypothetical protein
MKDHFNGQMETRSRPQIVSAEEQLKKAMQYQAWLNEGNKEGSIGDPSKDHGVKQRSLLYDLPYWQVYTLFSIVNLWELFFCQLYLVAEIIG